MYIVWDIFCCSQLVVVSCVLMLWTLKAVYADTSLVTALQICKEYVIVIFLFFLFGTLP